MKPQGPYRDERESLQAENEALRREVGRLKGTRRRRGLMVAGGLVLFGADALAFNFVRAMINGPNDANVAGGIALVVVLVVVHAVIALRVFARGE